MKKALVLFFFLLPACSQKIIHDTQIVTIKPANALLEPIHIEPFQGNTNEDLLLYMLTVEKNIHLCNAKLEAIKKSIE